MFRTMQLAPGLGVLLGLMGGASFAQGQDPSADRPNEKAPPVLHVQQVGNEYRLSLDGHPPIRATTRPIRNERLIEVPGSPMVLALWNEEEPGQRLSYYAISRDGHRFAGLRQTPYTIRLRHGDFEPLTQTKTVAPGLQSRAGQDLYIVQFVVQPMEEFVAAIRDLGGTVYNYLADHAHIVRMSPGVRRQVETLPYVRWVGPYHPAYRLEEVLLASLRGQGEPLGTRRYRIQVLEEGPVQKNAVADRIVAMGGAIDVLSPGGFLFEATLAPEQLRAVAGMNEVLFIDRWSPPRSCMNNVRIVGGANYVESAAGYTGAGVRAEVMDNGCGINHQDFAGRILVRGNSPVPVESHGTSTFGIVFGSGFGSSTARGMMPDAFGYFNDWTLQTSRHDDIGELVTSPYKCVFQTNSWGGTDTTQYTTVTAELDDAVFDFDIVILHSQGNSGTQAGVPQAWGKNVVGVGGIVHFDNANLSDDWWYSWWGGSIGPAADGRIKPDLSYYYDDIRTTTPSNGYTSTFGGTSAACPMTAGHFGLFFQMWADGIFGNPVSGGTVFQERSHSATARAVMINTAKSYSFSGTGHALTRTHQGWGLAHVRRLYDRRNNIFVLDEDHVLWELETRRYGRTIVAGEPYHDELRVTLHWTDVSGTTSSSQHRINDLTLKVTSPLSAVYYGNNGLLSGNWSTSGGSPNTIDTVENVFVQNPEPGIWTIEVTAAEINQDGHVETGKKDADYALVISGGGDCPLETVTQQPVDGSDCVNGTVVFTTAATGSPTYQWQRDHVDLVDGGHIAGATTPTLTVSPIDPGDVGTYRCKITNICGDELTVDISLTIDDPPAHAGSLPDLDKCEGDPVAFIADFTGASPMTFQWEKDGVPIPGEVSNVLTIDPVTPADAGDYRCHATNACGSAYTNTATLTVDPAPTITDQPDDTCVEAGETAVFTVAATGQGSLWYQWLKDGFDIPGEGGWDYTTLTLTNVQPGDAGQYGAYVVSSVSPTCLVYSNEAALTVGGCPGCLYATPGDMDDDTDVDLYDFALFQTCFGLGMGLVPGCECANMDESNDDVDLADYSLWYVEFNGPG